MAVELQQAPESLFWYWINERHAIYLRRMAGQPKPWTTDPILRDYKFTNAFRQLDRGTVWLTENFLKPHAWPEHHPACDWNALEPHRVCQCGANRENAELLAFNICWYRMFNWWGTGEFLGWQTDWMPGAVNLDLQIRLDQGHQVFTGAHIVYSPPGMTKIDAIVDVCTDLWNLRTQLIIEAQETNLLQAVFNLLKTVDCVGGFMAYEMVSDMRHTRLLSDATDIMTWANPGPGAKRGLQRLGLLYKRDADAIESMRGLLKTANTRIVDCTIHSHIASEPLGGHVPMLEMRDIEHSLCEFDKYCRVKFGEGEPRSKFNGAA